MQKRIYFVNFYYPPMGRSRRRYYYARALADAGFRVTVVTVANPSGFVNRYPVDPQSDVPDPEIEVVRLRVTPWWALGEALFAAGVLSCPQANWGRTLERELVPLLRREPGIVLSLYPPISSHRACLKAARAAGCPLVLDFRDEYLDLALRGMGRLFAGRARRIEAELVRGADLVSVTTENVRDNLLGRHRLDPAKVVVTYNGFGGRLPDVAPRDYAGPLRFVYAGAITGHQAPEIFCRAWRLLDERQPDVARQVFMSYYGPDNRYARKKLVPLLRPPHLSYGGFLPADEALARVREADVGFLSLAGDRYAYATPGKLFEYAGLGKPVVASVPERGAAAGIVKRHDLGLVAPAGDAGRLAGALAAMVSDRSLPRRFEKNALAARAGLTLREQVGRLAGEIERRFCS